MLVSLSALPWQMLKFLTVFVSTLAYIIGMMVISITTTIAMHMLAMEVVLPFTTYDARTIIVGDVADQLRLHVLQMVCCGRITHATLALGIITSKELELFGSGLFEKLLGWMSLMKCLQQW